MTSDTTDGTTNGGIDHLGNSYGRFFTEIGTRSDQPFKVLAPRDGLVYLPGIENSWVLQAFATSRARYFVDLAAGAAGMAHAFLIPSAHFDVLDWYTGARDDWALTPNLRLLDGRYVCQDDLFQSGWMQSGRIGEALAADETISMEKSSTVEMITTIDRIHQDTEAIFGWQSAPPPPLE